MDDSIYLGNDHDNNQRLHLLLRYANRHGVIAGATGTGKTVTLQTLAEGFSTAGVPVFATDIKGDLCGIAAPADASLHPKVEQRIAQIGFTEFARRACPVECWDVLAEQGVPVRITVAGMGSALISELLDLNDAQQGLLALCFEYCEQKNIALLDLKDLKAALDWIVDHAAELGSTYGKLSAASVSAVQRRLLMFEREGMETLLGEPALDYQDLMHVNADGMGVVNLLAANKLMSSPRVYATFLVALLSALLQQLPEVGDVDKPVLVLFFDEAHLLFDNAPPLLVEKLEQAVRLIRSKGVGVYFVTQSPADIPEPVLAQLGNRIQHALRAYTPKERKSLRVAAQSFRDNPAIADMETLLGELGVGEALVSVLEDKGVPGMATHLLVRPPCSRIGPLLPDERQALLDKSVMMAKYRARVDRQSAAEVLSATQSKAPPAADAAKEEERGKQSPSSRRANPFMAFLTSLLRALGSSLGRALIRELKRGLRR